MNGNNQNNGEEYIYKKVMLDKQHSRAWSIASLTIGIVSLLLFRFIGVGIALGILAIVFALLSRRNIGYFDGLSLAGLIIGIFGVVFGVGIIVLYYTIDVDSLIEQFTVDYYQNETPDNGALPKV